MTSKTIGILAKIDEWPQTCGRAADVHLSASDPVTARTRELAALGFGPLDALHLAFAEASAARWFVTTDDRLVKLSERNRERLLVETIRPDQVPIERI